MTNSRDAIYATHFATIADFGFDTEVARVFPDMIGRSVPGYASIISSIGLLARERVENNTNCYDLGCSLGASSLAMRDNIQHDNCKIFAIDNAAAMVEGCIKNVNAHTSNTGSTTASTTAVEVICADITTTPIENASMVVLNFTLQFVPLEKRQPLIARIYNGLLPNGVLVLSEKLAFENPQIQQLQIDMHHSFKRANGYSELEISQKRNALENVLIPETLNTHKERLRDAGFANFELWFQCFNFASLVAIK